MRTETKEFFDYTKSLPFKDITHFWDIPYKEMLDEVKSVDEKYWRRPFDADNDQIDRMKLDDSESVNHYPGLKAALEGAQEEEVKEEKPKPTEDTPEKKE